MDDYLKCLYDYVMEHLLTYERRNTLEYHRGSMAQDFAWGALKNSLNPEQLKLLESYQTARAKVYALEDKWLFQEAVSLGKWMARP